MRVATEPLCSASPPGGRPLLPSSASVWVSVGGAARENQGGQALKTVLGSGLALLRFRLENAKRHAEVSVLASVFSQVLEPCLQTFRQAGLGRLGSLERLHPFHLACQKWLQTTLPSLKDVTSQGQEFELFQLKFPGSGTRGPWQTPSIPANSRPLCHVLFIAPFSCTGLVLLPARRCEGILLIVFWLENRLPLLHSVKRRACSEEEMQICLRGPGRLHCQPTLRLKPVGGFVSCP